MSQSLSSRAMSFDKKSLILLLSISMFQSLSIRAMSFDFMEIYICLFVHCLNPFRAGRCLSTIMENFDLNDFLESQSLSSRAMSFDSILLWLSCIISRVSIPFEQGDVFRLNFMQPMTLSITCLNPFRAGRCLSTQVALQK